MEKTVTKEEVERVFKENTAAFVYEGAEKEILNELFPPEFKVGDWVVIGKDNDYYVNKSGEIGRITKLKKISCEVDCGHSSLGNSHNYCNLRHATPEEIAAAEWEEGEVYIVWLGEIEAVRVASSEVGRFYQNGEFKGKTLKHDKYEKL